MDQYLKLVFDWDQDLLTFQVYLESPRQSEALARFVAYLLTNPERRRVAEIHIQNSLEVFQAECQRPDLFLSDPLLIDRWVCLLHVALSCVPRDRPWVRAKIMVWCMQKISRQTRELRKQIILAHLTQPEKMACQSLPPDPSFLSSPN